MVAAALFATAASGGSAPQEPQALLVAQKYQVCISALRAGRYNDALAGAKAGYKACPTDPKRSARVLKCQAAFQLMLANAHQLRCEYREAVAAFKTASELSAQIGDREYEAGAAAGLSNIYRRLGQSATAESYAGRALRLMPPNALPSVRSEALQSMADIKWSMAEREEAARLFLKAIDEADRAPDPSTLATAWNMFGYDLLQSDNLLAADVALTQGFRLRLLFKTAGLDSSYRNLGMLRLRQGDVRSAMALLNRAAKMFEAGHSRIPGWSLYFRRAQAYRAAGNLPAAFSDLERSLALARTWRAGIFPAEEVQSRTDLNLDMVYDEYVSTGMELWSRHHDSNLLTRIFVAVEENRAASVRQDRSWRANLPSVYWEVLAQLRRLRIGALAHDPEATPQSLLEAQARLSELESSAGLFAKEKPERISPIEALSSFRHQLKPGDAFVSFQIGDTESFAWALTSTQLQVSRLPGRHLVEEAVRRVNAALLAGNPFDQAASDLYGMLFGGLSPLLERAPDWILSLDDELFDVPYAALRANGRFLAERHSVRSVPSAFLLDGARNAQPPRGLVAVADAIYNSADPRWQEPAVSRPQSSPPAFRTLELARLPASATEIGEIARFWEGGPVLTLTGRDANRGRIEGALGAHPSAVHFAIHVVPSTQNSDQALMAVGLDRSGRPDFYTPEEVAATRRNIPLVVLSGCSSGQGEVLSGAGRMGLTRAWLISGSRSVVASLWPTADESGAIFSAMYRNLGGSTRPLSARRIAQSLQTAQVAMIRTASWRAQPRYWGAFFVIGRD